MASSGYQEVMVALRGGLNTALDPSIIDNDQLVEAYGMEYRPPRLGLFAVGGRSRFDTAFSATAGTRVHGLNFCSRAQGYPHSPTGVGTDLGYTQFLVAFSGTTGFVASATGTGYFTKFLYDFGPDGTATATLTWSNTATAFADAVHHENEWFVFNGVNYARKAWYDPSADLAYFYSLGFQAVTASANGISTAIAGATLAAGSYEGWWTEVTLPTFLSYDPIESAYIGTVTKFYLSATGLAAQFQTPGGVNYRVNKSSTYRNFYLSQTGGKYPFGFLHGQETIETGSTAHSVTAFDATTPYPIVSPSGGVPVSANMQPPRPYTMVSFQGCLVAIDADARTSLRWSLAGEHHYWPATNVAYPNEGDIHDNYNALALCNGSLLVFASRYAHAFDFLPQASDSEDMDAATGRAYKKFLSGHGCVGPRAACTFTTPNGFELCIFMCRDGIHITDGTRFGDVTLVDWANFADLASAERFVFRNNPKRYRCELYYIDKADTTKFYRMDFYYHPALITPASNGLMGIPCMGPTRVPGLSSTVGIGSDNDYRVWCASETAGAIWNEGTGSSDDAQIENADGRITHSWKTKNFYLAGVNGEWELFKAYTHQSQTTASGSYTITGEGRTDDTGTSFIATSTVDQSETGAQQHPALHQRAQRFSVRGEKTDGGAWQELNYLVFVVKGATELQTGKSS